MKGLTISCFLLLTFYSNAQTYKLDFQPQGKIIEFYFDSLIVFTDTTSLFSIYDKKGDLKAYDLRIKNFVRRKVNEVKSDTVTFSGNFIPINDSINNKYQENWYLEWAIINLVKVKQLIMFDKHGQLVTTIVTKKLGKKKNNYVKRSYMNKNTGEELINELLYMVISDPPF